MDVLHSTIDFGRAAAVTDPPGPPSVLVVCEHASNRVPRGLDLGVLDDVLESHVAWDPGALGVAAALAERLGAVLVAGTISRLVYDCNRPPEAESAVPAVSEAYAIPGNAGLSDADRAARVANVFAPFSATVADQITHYRDTLTLMVTIHSFTPVYAGQTRNVEIGLLHGRDTRFAEAMLARKPEAPAYDTRLNAPYSAADGVAHTLDMFGPSNGLQNVMIEIRNDLIATRAEQDAMAAHLAPWITATLAEASA